MSSLRERIIEYQEIADTKLLPKVPIIVVLNGRHFSKNTAMAIKPFDSVIMECMCAAMVKLCQEVDGCVFSLTYNDQIILITKNDQTADTLPWFNNSAQSIISAASSIATLEFNRAAISKNLQLLGSATFTGKVFAVPNITEVINFLLYAQQKCFHTALHQACFYELIKRYDAERAQQMLANKNPKEKADILFNECKIEFNNLPLAFRRGVACLRMPRANPQTKEIKYKFSLNAELPLFSVEKDWLYSIFKSGSDILRMNKDVDFSAT